MPEQGVLLMPLTCTLLNTQTHDYSREHASLSKEHTNPLNMLIILSCPRLHCKHGCKPGNMAAHKKAMMPLLAG